MTTGQLPAAYPVQFGVDYPEVERNRLTVAFRIVLAIPALIVLCVLNSTRALLFLPPLLLILFRDKYPRWWFDWNLQLLRFENRVSSYLLLLRDEYPSTDEEQAVHLEIRYPNVTAELNRGLPLVKWLLAIPHYIVLAVLGIAVAVVAIAGWFVVLFTGRLPQGMFDFIVGFLRWSNRVTGYAYILVTDIYPPFRLVP
ncbi:MAG: DUF4389 domain-containing protein [Frankiaceae bacterium]